MDESLNEPDSKCTWWTKEVGVATLLEVIIMKLTHESPSGGICRIGDASFTVRYCSDIWEWEYLNETFWDVQDLAHAIERESAARPQKVPFLPKSAQVKRSSFKTKLLKWSSGLNPNWSHEEVIPPQAMLRMNPVPLRLVNFRSVSVP
jgi:hypothetical protein